MFVGTGTGNFCFQTWNSQWAVPFMGTKGQAAGQILEGSLYGVGPVSAALSVSGSLGLWTSCWVWVRLGVGILSLFLPVFTILPTDCC